MISKNNKNQNSRKLNVPVYNQYSSEQKIFYKPLVSLHKKEQNDEDMKSKRILANCRERQRTEVGLYFNFINLISLILLFRNLNYLFYINQFKT